MELEITKNDFERILPVGTSAHESLFEKIQPVIEEHKRTVAGSILGPEGVEMMDNEPGAALKFYVVAYICVSAFLSVLRQLDLVLTPTGFGVISSEKYAPASKMRVDALEGQLLTREARYLGEIIDYLRGPEWGKTSQAQTQIRYLYNAHEFFNLGNTRPTYQEWNAFFPTLLRADEILRTKIGNAQMDALLEAYRCRDVDVFTMSMEAHIFRFIYSMMHDGEAKAVTTPLLGLISYIDSNQEIYTEWAHSKEYDAFHHEGFKNTRDSSAYIFG